MTIRIINIASFIALHAVILLFGQVGERVLLSLTCVLLVIFISGIINEFIMRRRWDQPKPNTTIVVVIVGLFMGYISSRIMGTQYHDIRDGGPSLGIPTWPIMVNLMFPISFLIFICCTGYLKNRYVHLGILLTWILATLIEGYFLGVDYTSFTEDSRNEGLNYDSTYFPSGTKIITQLVMLTTLFWTLLSFIKRSNNRPEPVTQQQG